MLYVISVFIYLKQYFVVTLIIQKFNYEILKAFIFIRIILFSFFKSDYFGSEHCSTSSSRNKLFKSTCTTFTLSLF